MTQKKTLIFLLLLLASLAAFATLRGILSEDGPGNYLIQSIRGEHVTIYGIGIYKHMSASVAIQGIAQDYITLFLGIPMLLVSFFYTMKGRLVWRFILTGTLGYFFVTYLFYLVMAMYNELFLVYTTLMGTSFYALMVSGLSFDLVNLPSHFKENTPVRVAGGFLIFTSICIGILWLSIVIPPLMDGSIYPLELEHYTTLIVQGLDLGLLLPLAFLSGILLIQKRPLGFLLAPSYLVFLSILMTALVAKIIYMGLEGANIFPVIMIIPALALLAMICCYLLFKHITK